MAHEINYINFINIDSKTILKFKILTILAQNIFPKGLTLIITLLNA
jgi:hypothetical protein